MSAIYPPKPGRGTRCGPARPCAGAACEAVWLLGGASTAHAEPPARLPCLNCGTAALCSARFRCEETQTTLRGHSCCDAHGRLRDALRREAPERGRRPAIAICPTQPFPTGLQAPGARRWPRLPVCPYRQARLSACPHWQAQQARRPSTQSPKHLAAQPSSASERQDKEAACGPHFGMDSIAHRWYRSGEGPVFARPVLHRKSVCGTI